MVYYADSIDQVRKHTLLEEVREGRSKEVYVCVCVCRGVSLILLWSDYINCL